jgi:hypothetical protein
MYSSSTLLICMREKRIFQIIWNLKGRWICIVDIVNAQLSVWSGTVIVTRGRVYFICKTKISSDRASYLLIRSLSAFHSRRQLNYERLSDSVLHGFRVQKRGQSNSCWKTYDMTQFFDGPCLHNWRQPRSLHEPASVIKISKRQLL